MTLDRAIEADPSLDAVALSGIFTSEHKPAIPIAVSSMKMILKSF
ncbi:hypothetical protein [Rhizobium gallicum]|nr:hypothetical protein [Rhizobium gallicum]